MQQLRRLKTGKGGGGVLRLKPAEFALAQLRRSSLAVQLPEAPLCVIFCRLRTLSDTL